MTGRLDERNRGPFLAYCLCMPVLISTSRTAVLGVLVLPIVRAAIVSPPRLHNRVVIVGSANNTNSTNSTDQSSPTANSTANSTSNSTVPSYTFDIPPDNDSALKFLYLIFLVFGVVIVLLVVRIFIVKRRRTRKLLKTSLVRAEALRMDMERHSSNNRPSNGSSGSEMAERRQSYHSDDELWQPPPPYPTHVQPLASAYIRGSRLPVYDELEEEEENNVNSNDSTNIEQHLASITDSPERTSSRASSRGVSERHVSLPRSSSSIRDRHHT
jgi:hypothetical protein